MQQRIPATEQAVRHALRTVRATAYRVGTGPEGVALALLMRASEPARRTAAQRIVGLLGAHDLTLDADDPVAALLAGERDVPVAHRAPPSP